MISANLRLMIRAGEAARVSKVNAARSIKPQDFPLYLKARIDNGKGTSIIRPGHFEGLVLLDFMERRLDSRQLSSGKYNTKNLNLANMNAGVSINSPYDVDYFALRYLSALIGSNTIITFPWTEWMAAIPAVQQSKVVRQVDFDPIHCFFRSEVPWTQMLTGLDVAIVTPFAKSLALQLSRVREISISKDLWPECRFRIVDAPVTFGGEGSSLSWQSELHKVNGSLDSSPYDVVLIAAGSYGTPIADHARQQGKIGIHIGSLLHPMFGIVGKRDRDYLNHYLQIFGAMPDNWISPSTSERPTLYKSVEGGAYW